MLGHFSGTGIETLSNSGTSQAGPRTNRLYSAREPVEEASRSVFPDPLPVKPSQLIEFFGAIARRSIRY